MSESTETTVSNPKRFPIKRVIIWTSIFLVLAVLVTITLYYRYLNFLKAQVIREVTIESGSPFGINDFFTDEAPNTYFVTDISGINTAIPNTYTFKVRTGKYHVETIEDVVLHIIDTTPPTATAIPQLIYTDEIPDAKDIVTNIYDLASVEVDYQFPLGDSTAGGERDIPVKITDAYGNVTIVDVPFVIIDDPEPPTITGAEDREAFIGDIILYRENVRVRDNYDPSPVLEVDSSAVNMQEEGTYPVTYTATDEHGNTSSVTIKLTMRIKPDRYYEPEELYKLARQIIDENNICDESMSDMEITLRIFDWVSRNMWYINTSDRVDWTAGAYDGLTTLRGDCYNYMAVARAMLGAMGIESITIDRYPTVPSTHFWNLVNIDGEWYHCDACVFLNMTDITFFCLKTDDEINPHHSSYDHDLLPEEVHLATESVQDRIDLNTLTVKEKEE